MIRKTLLAAAALVLMGSSVAAQPVERLSSPTDDSEALAGTSAYGWGLAFIIMASVGVIVASDHHHQRVPVSP